MGWRAAAFLIITGITSSLNATAAQHKSGRPVGIKSFRADLVEPGKTEVKDLQELLGRPRQVVAEGVSRKYYFYNLGEGSTMDATVVVRKGMVEYLTYLCSDTVSGVRQKYADQKPTERKVDSRSQGYRGQLTQLVYEDIGRAFVYEPKSLKVRACVAWMPGRKFEELGR